MNQDYQTYPFFLTDIGRAMVADSIHNGADIGLAEMAVGDGDYTPSPGQTALVSEKARVPIIEIVRDGDNPAWMRIMSVLPPDVGGWRIHEFGIYAENGNLFAVGKLDGAYKPLMNSNMGKEIGLDVVLEIAAEANVVLMVDPNVIIATRQWVMNYFGPKMEGLSLLIQGKVAKTFRLNTVSPVTGGGVMDGESLTFSINRATEMDLGVTRLGTVAETQAGTSDKVATHPKGVMALVRKMCGELETKIEKISFAAITKVWPHEIPLMWRGKIADIPKGWVLCDGQNGTPDLRDRFIIGAGMSYAVDDVGGSTEHHHRMTGSVGNTTITLRQMPYHKHTQYGYDAHTSASGPALITAQSSQIRALTVTRSDVSAAMSNTGGNESHTHDLTGLTTKTGSNMGPYYALAFIMRKGEA